MMKRREFNEAVVGDGAAYRTEHAVDLLAGKLQSKKSDRPRPSSFPGEGRPGNDLTYRWPPLRVRATADGGPRGPFA
jgi:hypothetical protein